MNGKLRQLFLAGGIVAVSGSLAHAQDFSARLNGFEEVGGVGAAQTGAILSNGKGTLSLDVNQTQISYRLTYSGLTDTQQAHIHFGKIHVGGGIMAWLCQTPLVKPSPTPGTPTCPANGGLVVGTLTADSIIGPTAQNVTPRVFGALIDALNSNTAYANVHTAKFPAGEIRGQVRRAEQDEQ
jgi:hypothetical protein